MSTVRATVSASRTPGGLLRDVVAAAKAGVEEAADFWDDAMLPDHFKDGAASKYGYARRSGEGEPAMVYSTSGKGTLVERGGKARRLIKNPKYFHRKRREGHGTTPLVRTGKTQRMATSGGTIKSRRRGDVVEGYDVLPVERHFYQRAKGSQVDKAKEVTATTGPERDTLRQVVERTIAREIQHRKTSGRRRG